MGTGASTTGAGAGAPLGAMRAALAGVARRSTSAASGGGMDGAGVSIGMVGAVKGVATGATGAASPR